MKIGILTFNESINYGSILQAWALQNVLLNSGYDVQIIDYEPEAYHRLYDIFKRPLSPNNVVVNIKRLPIAPFLKLQRDQFKKFCSQHLIVSSEKYYFTSNIKTLEERYDCIVCGSDQIWNVRADDCDPIFFLPDVSNVKKIAYGISINDTDYSETRYAADLYNWILDFDYISMRERSGVQKTSKFIESKKQLAVVLDPTLLCRREDFIKIASHSLIKQNYIFLYSAWYNKQIAEAGKILSQKLNLPIYTVVMGRSFRNIIEFYQNGVHFVFQHAGPSEFIRLIADATFVLTDSFHGTAFSLIMEKPFVSINYSFQSETLKNDERILGILTTLGLQSRYVSINQLIEFDYSNAIDYEHITKERLLLAEDSRHWLYDAINNKADFNE